MSGSQLPYAHAAVVKDAKIRDYLLDPSHPQNNGKAQFFNGFGFTAQNWRRLRDALVAHPNANLVVNVISTGYSTKFEVQCTLASPDGRNPCVRSFWVLNLGTTVPQFLTAYACPPPIGLQAP